MRREKNKRQTFLFILTVCFMLICGTFAVPGRMSAAEKKWNVKVNNTGNVQLVKKKDQWYLESDTLDFSNLKSAERVVYLKISSKSGLSNGYYYFDADGRLDQRKMFHNLNTKIGNVKFRGKFYFGDLNGRLYQKTGWITVKGKKYALNKMGKMYTNCWYKGYYLMGNGRVAVSRQVSANTYVDAYGRKCKKFAEQHDHSQ